MSSYIYTYVILHAQLKLNQLKYGFSNFLSHPMIIEFDSSFIKSINNRISIEKFICITEPLYDKIILKNALLFRLILIVKNRFYILSLLSYNSQPTQYSPLFSASLLYSYIHTVNSFPFTISS